MCVCSLVSDSLWLHGLQSDRLLCPWSLLQLTGSSVDGIFQTRILEWVAISYSRGSSWPRDRTHISRVSCISSWIPYHWDTWEALGLKMYIYLNIHCLTNNRAAGSKPGTSCAVHPLQHPPTPAADPPLRWPAGASLISPPRHQSLSPQSPWWECCGHEGALHNSHSL